VIQKYWESTREDIPILTRKVINEYLLSLKLTNKAEATITKYRWILERFFSECLVSLDELISEDVLTWLNKFSAGKNTKTLNLFLSTLSSFFQFCLEEEFLENMVMKTRWRLKIPQGLPNYLTEQEYAQVKLTAEKLTLRDRALVLFLFSSGCRRAEVAKLCIENVNLDRRTAEILGKGNKYRQIHFSVECAIVLKEYLLTRTYEKKDPLFMNKFGNKLQSNGIYNVVRKLGEMAGL